MRRWRSVPRLTLCSILSDDQTDGLSDPLAFAEQQTKLRKDRRKRGCPWHHPRLQIAVEAEWEVVQGVVGLLALARQRGTRCTGEKVDQKLYV